MILPQFPAPVLYARVAVILDRGFKSMRKIYSTTVPGQAQMLQVVLRNYGIESRLDNENAAMLAVGMAIPAVPIGILVDDDRAEEAAQIVAEELRKPGPANPTAVHLQIRCRCGRILEYPKGEEPPDECPYCGRALDETAPTPHAGATKTSRKPAAFAFGILILVAAGYAIFHKTIDRPALQAHPSPKAWADRLRRKIEQIPSVEVPKIDPDAIAGPLVKEFPVEAARFAAALDAAKTVDDLIARWNRESIELSPDWAMEHGFVDSPRLSRYSIRADRIQILLNSLALRKLRSIPTPAPTIDARLLERHLERILLGYLIFGPKLTDPRPAAWGVTACIHALDQPALLAERLEQVPAVIEEILRDLADTPHLWFEVAVADLNSAFRVLLEIERRPMDDRLKSAVAAAREALDACRTELRKRQKADPRPAPCDPRWVTYLIRDLEFSGRTPRGTAAAMLETAIKSSVAWAALSERPKPDVSPYTEEEWRRELERLTAKARDLVLQHRFVEVPPGELPAVRPSPMAGPQSAEWPGYVARSFATTFQPVLWMMPWESAASRKSCSPDTALVALTGEAFPGRHVQTLLSRRDASLMRRIYWSSSTPEGWAAYGLRWGMTVAPANGFDLKYLEGSRYAEAWCNAVELCYLSGTMTEFEAIEFLRGALGYTEEEARNEIAWATLAPLFSIGRSLGQEDITRLREGIAGMLGDRFDLSRFHTRLLGYGRTPVALIREEMLRDLK